MRKEEEIKTLEISNEVLSLVSARVAQRYSVLPVARDNGTLRLLVPADLARQVKEELQILLGFRLEFVAGDREEIDSLIAKHHGVGAEVIEALAKESGADTGQPDLDVIDRA